MASSDGAYGEVELRPSRKFANPRLSALDQPKVADAASELFRDVFGEDKTSVRMVLGVASLPLGMPVAVEVILEVEA
jgi:enamine deaminase RidA (YjgF/YER057c/UK114 family)